ncbi:putative Ig domain-containing protein [Congregibacter sp.]|uniref:putative Ig domain-containing protein n=1 Tax=Congregibacter sp. TaxID=2744308 RepID=UPI003F6C5DF6
MARYMRSIILAAATMILVACGGGSGDGGGFLPDAAVSDLAITTTALDPVIELPYSVVLEATGGVGPYSWSLVSDGDTGFTLDSFGVLRADSAVIDGTYGLTFQVEDSRGTTLDKSLTLVVSVTSLSVVSTALPDAAEGSVYSTVLEADGGVEPYNWALEDAGGTGFTMTSAGVLSGTVLAVPGGYGVTVSVTDGRGVKAERSYVLTVTGEPTTPLEISTNTLSDATQSSLYAAVLVASGGSGDYLWSLVDDGNTNLRLSDEGVLSGRVPSTVGLFGLTLEVSDGATTAVRSLTLNVTDVEQVPITVNTGPLPAGQVTVPYAAVVNASGGSGSYTWSLISDGGSGLSLSTGGVLSGTFTDSGDYGVTVRAFDGFSSNTGSFTISVGDFGDEFSVLTIQTSSLPEATAGEPYAVVLTASGGTPPYAWGFEPDDVTGADGSGLSLSSIGLLSGTPPTAGIYSLTVRVTSGGVSVPRLLTLTVN